MCVCAHVRACVCVCVCVCVYVCVCAHVIGMYSGCGHAKGRGSPAMYHHGGGNVEGAIEVPDLLDEVDEAMPRDWYSLFRPSVVLKVVYHMPLTCLKGKEMLTHHTTLLHHTSLIHHSSLIHHTSLLHTTPPPHHSSLHHTTLHSTTPLTQPCFLESSFCY